VGSAEIIAANTYRDDLAISDRLATADPGNAGWERDQSVSYNKIGDVPSLPVPQPKSSTVLLPSANSWQ
jgi:hypothetical protein